ncbi:hypothetical protein JCM10908_003796 [Rhodotorula pacifica]|uniref:uncharacterized protein n=1 Tax=Rhodotorula pacifica TaxID=1495444 RepID=UPI003171B7E2
MDIPVSATLLPLPNAYQASPIASTSSARAAPPHSAQPQSATIQITASSDGAGSGSALVKTAQKRSCAACKLRRVKCERPGGDDADCIGCVKRGWQCVPAEVKARPQHRNGKRVKAVQELLADSAASSPASVTDSPKAVALRTPRVSGTSLDIRLGDIELRESVMSNLLETFFTFRTIATFSREVDFHMTFNRAGRRLDQLSDVNQVLCATLIAMGSRCSDHPAILGSTGLRITDLGEATRQDIDLTSYGKARQGQFVQLAKQAHALADEKGIYKKKSPESIATLMFLEGMNVSDAPIDPLFSRTCATQVRDLLAEAHDQPAILKTLQDTTLAWTAVIRDALAAAYYGSACSLSDDDLWLLRGMQNPPPSLIDRLAATPDPTRPEENFWSFIDSLVEHIVQLCRAIPAGLTSVRALKAARLDEESARDCLERSSLAVVACRELRARAKALPVPPGFLRDAETLARTLSLSAFNISFILKGVVGKRLDSRPGGKVDSPNAPPSPEDSDEYWDRLQQFDKMVDREVFQCCRDIVSVFKDVLQAGIPLGTHEWLDPRSIQVLFSRATLWIGVLLRAPLNEEGGLSNYSIDEKLDDLRWIARALRSIGWSSAKHAECLPWVEREVRELELRRSWYYPAGLDVRNSTVAMPMPVPPSFDPHFLVSEPNIQLGAFHPTNVDPTSYISPTGSSASDQGAFGAGSDHSPSQADMVGSANGFADMDASAMLAAIGEPFPTLDVHTQAGVVDMAGYGGTPEEWNAYTTLSDEALLSAMAFPSQHESGMYPQR